MLHRVSPQAHLHLHLQRQMKKKTLNKEEKEIMNFNMQDSKKRKHKWECEICYIKISDNEKVIVEEAIVCKNPNCLKKAEEETWFDDDK